MRQIFRLRIAGKRQITIPGTMLNALHLAEGDELRFEVLNGRILRVIPFKSVPTTLFDEKTLHFLAKREKQIDEERGNGSSIDELLEDNGTSGYIDVTAPEEEAAVGNVAVK